MNTSAFLALSIACAPLVHPTTSRAVVEIESGLNANAIGVVGSALQRQPRSKAEAIVTAEQLISLGRNFSVGLAQINIRNLHRLGLSVADGFDSCKSLAAMQSIMSECFDRSKADMDEQARLRLALSCYYSGNFTTGFRHGYVSRVIRNA